MAKGLGLAGDTALKVYVPLLLSNRQFGAGITEIREDFVDDEVLKARFKHHLNSFDDPQSVTAVKQLLTVGVVYRHLFAS